MKLVFRVVVSLAVVVGAILSQQPVTTIPPSMLRESNQLDSPPSAVAFYAGDLKGNLFKVKPGVGLVLRSTADGWVLDAAAAKPQVLVRRVLVPNEAGHFLVSPDAAIYRNGVLMTVGLDYEHNGAGVLPKVLWTGDLVVAMELVSSPIAVAKNAPSGQPTLTKVSQIKNWDQVSNRQYRPFPDPLYRSGIGVNQLSAGRIGPPQVSADAACVWWTFSFVRQPTERHYAVDCDAQPPVITELPK